MQTFTFGHPCEHQLRRTCIGGVSCPLNGYPDMWCCSFIKGKINFKRDRPCEGQRCRWNFTHPTQNHFDTVNTILKDSRVLASKLEDATVEIGSLSFNLEAHPADLAYCAIQMMKIPNPLPSTNRKVGHLVVCAVIKANDAKVFGALMRVCKKPLDYALIGAFDHVNLVSPARGTKKRKDDVGDEIRSELVDLMFGALATTTTAAGATASIGTTAPAVLVDREEQRSLQIAFIRALRTPTFLKNKKKQEMLDAALAKFPVAASKVEVPPLEGGATNLVTSVVTSGASVAPAPSQGVVLNGPVGPAAVCQQQPPSATPNALLSLRLDDGDGSDQPKWVGISKVPKEFLPSSSRDKFTPIQPMENTWDVPVLGGLFSLYPGGRSLLGALLENPREDSSDSDGIVGSAAVAAA